MHSQPPKSEKNRILGLSRDAMIETVREHLLLGRFQSLLDGTESLHVPVYAVWGNHEDIHVVERLHRGETAVKNLHVVDHRSHVSPGKEPFVELIAARTRVDFTVSGHMGAPNCVVWNPFAVRSPEEAENRLNEGLAAVQQRCLRAVASKAARIEQHITKQAQLCRGVV